eukprot:COSAG02_NODE_2268_length_9281_cov_8.820518_3_plen_621_part_00
MSPNACMCNWLAGVLAPTTRIGLGRGDDAGVEETMLRVTDSKPQPQPQPQPQPEPEPEPEPQLQLEPEPEPAQKLDPRRSLAQLARQSSDHERSERLQAERERQTVSAEQAAVDAELRLTLRAIAALETTAGARTAKTNHTAVTTPLLKLAADAALDLPIDRLDGPTPLQAAAQRLSLAKLIQLDVDVLAQVATLVADEIQRRYPLAYSEIVGYDSWNDIQGLGSGSARTGLPHSGPLEGPQRLGHVGMNDRRGHLDEDEPPPVSRKLLSSWLAESCAGEVPALELLYRGGDDGWDARVWHRKCDGQGPTLTLIEDDDGYVFGGYADADWDSNGQDIASKGGAFLFCLRSPGDPKQPSVRISLTGTKNQQAMNGMATLGPGWGSGVALRLGYSMGHNDADGSRVYVGMRGGAYDLGDKGRSLDTGECMLTGPSQFQTRAVEVYRAETETQRTTRLLANAQLEPTYKHHLKAGIAAAWAQLETAPRGLRVGGFPKQSAHSTFFGYTIELESFNGVYTVQDGEQTALGFPVWRRADAGGCDMRRFLYLSQAQTPKGQRQEMVFNSELTPTDETRWASAEVTWKVMVPAEIRNIGRVPLGTAMAWQVFTGDVFEDFALSVSVV